MSTYTAPPYNSNNVIVGDSAVYIAPKGTALPADTGVLFDPTLFTGKTLTANGATAITLSVTTSAGTAATSSLTGFATITAAAVQTALEGLTNVGAGNVLVTGAAGGPFTIVFANSIGPATLTVTASTGGTGPTITGGLWVPPGATESGWTFGATSNTQTIGIEEQSTPVGKFVTSRSVTVSANLSEDTQANWQLALNTVKSLIAQGVGQPGMTVQKLTDALIHYAVVHESVNEFGYATRKYIPDAVSAEALSVVYRRATAQRMLNVSFESVCPIDQIQSRAVTSPAL